MREILFRGKRKDNEEWVKGHLGIEVGNQLVIEYCDFDDILDEYCVKERFIIPETVGQYTGLTDKNGAKIFEGDIIEGDLEDNLDLGAKWRSVVVMGKFGWLADDPTGSAPTPLDEFDIKEGEVIGNIHDNPELMEKE